MKPLTLNLQYESLLKIFKAYAPAISSVLLLVYACYLAATISWQVFAPSTISSNTKQQQSPIKINKQANEQFQQGLIRLNNAHLFGTASSPLAKNAAEDAPETTLNLVLRGILAAQPMTHASVIISAGKNAAELTYGMGDSVPGNATIEEIHAGHVVLMRNGRLETLRLPEKSIGLSDTIKTTSGPTPLNTNQSADRILGDIRRNIMKNPTSFGEYAIPVPVSKNGKLQGYRLRPQKKGRELFKQFGLQRNDIVTQVNGVGLTDPVQGIAALRKLSNASSINLTVLRNGVETPLQFNIR